MIYPADFENKIDFEQIRNLLKTHCISTLGKRQVDKIRISTSYSYLQKVHTQTDEFIQILLSNAYFPAQNYFDMTQEINRLQTEGTFIEIENLCNLRDSLHTIDACLIFFKNEQNISKYPQLSHLSTNMDLHENYLLQIDEIIDNKGVIKDTASEQLSFIRRQIRETENELSALAKKNLQFHKQLKLIDDNAELNIRDGAFVLPVPAVNKRKVKGIIRDVSASGQTYFIEPQDIYESNNHLHNLQLEERREIVLILKQFTDNLRPCLPSVLEGYNYLSIIDFIRAKAKFALQMNACKPIISNQPFIHWKKAVHPLLWLHLKSKNKPVVPMDIVLGEKFKILVISGPNAGGKSVCLKTLALTQYSFQCGLPVCCSPLSEFGIFKDIFIDIGDEQSIDNDLSTYSSHLKNMQILLSKARPDSLFLLDELGGGTDPHYGEAIAEALLETLAAKNACGLVTTHFGKLKMMALNNSKIENGAMLFDTNEMRPLFELKIGQYGTSFTFEIAQKSGLNPHILARATQIAGKEKIKYDQLLHRLQNKEKEVDEQKKSLEIAQNQFIELKKEYEEKLASLQTQQAKILKTSRQEAQNLLKDTNKLIEKTVKEIREHQANKEVTKKAKAEIQKVVQQMEEENKKEIPPATENEKIADIDPQIALYDTVIMEDTHTIGEITTINGDEVVVSFNSINVRTDKKNVRKISRTEAKKIRKSGSLYPDLSKKTANFSLQLDIRGFRADEALQEVEKYLDDAALLSIHQVSILHGKGNGILRLKIREFLRKQRFVKAFYDQKEEFGGTGITVVEM
ncbi:MAG: Smr/MutS family protein [Bacteroidales bacterium]|jgi:DNA mismatch repair protein MutS2|nr:Smr/MutS family protein [Bacteroidales bacterium]